MQQRERVDLRGQLVDFTGDGEFMAHDVQTGNDITPLDQFPKWATSTQLHNIDTVTYHYAYLYDAKSLWL